MRRSFFGLEHELNLTIITRIDLWSYFIPEQLSYYAKQEKYPVRWKNESGYQKNTLVFDWNNRYRQRGLVSLGRKSDVIARCISGILVGNEPRFPENVDVSIRVKRVQEKCGWSPGKRGRKV